MSNVRREPKGSVFVFSSSGAIGRAVLCRLEERSPKDSWLGDSNRWDLLELIVENLIFWAAWLNVSAWASSWVSSNQSRRIPPVPSAFSSICPAPQL